MKKLFNFYRRGSRKENKIALTFDDGPSEETIKVLDLLKKYNAKATFFIWGERIRGREKILRRMIKEGHELANHSYSHKRLVFKSRKFIEEEILKCDEELSKLKIKTKLFRFPGFQWGLNGFIICRKLNKKVIFADSISGDWKKKGVNYAVSNIRKKTKNGSILNFHDYLEGIGRNEEIVPIIKAVLPELKKKFKIVTVSDLLNFK